MPDTDNTAVGEPVATLAHLAPPVARVESLNWAAEHVLPELVDTDLPEIKIVMHRGNATTVAGAAIVDIGTAAEKYRTTPRRKQLNRTVVDTDSFCRFVTTHRDDPHTTLWVEPEKLALLAILDDHGPAEARFGEQRITLRWKNTPEWERWAQQSGKFLSQSAFGELITEGIGDIRPKTAGDPAAILDGADWIELADTFQSSVKINTKSKVNRQSGGVSFTFDEEEKTTAGRDGRITIPQKIGLRLRPFVGADFMNVDARFIYRVTSDGPTFGIKIDNAREIILAAVAKECDVVSAALGLEPYVGVLP